jgi:hypothetical protein
LRNGLDQAVTCDLRLAPRIDGRGDRGGCRGRRARRIRDLLQGLAQFADFHRVNRPIVGGSQLHRTGGIAFVAAAREHEYRQMRCLLARTRQPCQRIGRVFSQAELDDEKQGGVAGNALPGQRVEACAIDAVRVQSRSCAPHYSCQPQAQLQVIVHDQAANGGALDRRRGRVASFGACRRVLHRAFRYFDSLNAIRIFVPTAAGFPPCNTGL